MSSTKLLPVLLEQILTYTQYKPESFHEDIIQWKHFPSYWPFVWGIHRSPHKDQWRGALMLSLICAWINNSWVNNREAGDLRCHWAHYDIVMCQRKIESDFREKMSISLNEIWVNLQNSTHLLVIDLITYVWIKFKLENIFENKCNYYKS